MRPFGTAAAPAFVICLALALAAGSAQVATADDSDIPTQSEVHEAERAVVSRADDVASIQAALTDANDRLRVSSIAAAQAAEAFNGARYLAAQARTAAGLAEREEQAALADVDRLRATYASAAVTSYQAMPSLNALSGVMESEGILDVIENLDTMRDTEAALNDKYDEFRIASARAEIATGQASEARDEAVASQSAAREARDAAQAAADEAAAQAQSVAGEKAGLLADLARLQDISVKLAEKRQAGLEAAAAEAAAQEAAREAAQEAAQQAAADQAAQEQAAADQADAEQQEESASDETTEPDPQPTTDPTPEPTPEPEATPPPASGVPAVIAFARDQIGEPYVWGAAGPGSWDCSGLTMGAWGAGGRSLPHYSVAQYDASTPISSSDLRPGDLLFWGSSSSVSSIYHVALYVGAGRMIHAPRTGQPVQEASMYYWTPPNFFGRP